MLLIHRLIGLMGSSPSSVLLLHHVDSWSQNLDIVMLSGHATILQDVSNLLSTYIRYAVRVIPGF